MGEEKHTRGENNLGRREVRGEESEGMRGDCDRVGLVL